MNVMTHEESVAAHPATFVERMREKHDTRAIATFTPSGTVYVNRFGA